MMRLVRLETRDGGFVAEILMPPFQLMPEGVMWGERTFFPAVNAGRPEPVYREGLLWVAPPHTTIKPRPEKEAPP